MRKARPTTGHEFFPRTRRSQPSCRRPWPIMTKEQAFKPHGRKFAVHALTGGSHRRRDSHARGRAAGILLGNRGDRHHLAVITLASEPSEKGAFQELGVETI